MEECVSDWSLKEKSEKCVSTIKMKEWITTQTIQSKFSALLQQENLRKVLAMAVARMKYATDQDDTFKI